MRALSVRQPWAWAIAAAGKDVENRSWKSGYRGLIAIHAAMTREDAGGLPLRSLACAYEADRGFPAAASGAVVAVADLAGCHRHHPHRAACRPHGPRPPCLSRRAGPRAVLWPAGGGSADRHFGLG